jgi:hypothetical protein
LSREKECAGWGHKIIKFLTMGLIWININIVSPNDKQI